MIFICVEVFLPRPFEGRVSESGAAWSPLVNLGDFV